MSFANSVQSKAEVLGGDDVANSNMLLIEDHKDGFINSMFHSNTDYKDSAFRMPPVSSPQDHEQLQLFKSSLKTTDSNNMNPGEIPTRDGFYQDSQN